MFIFFKAPTLYLASKLHTYLFYFLYGINAVLFVTIIRLLQKKDFLKATKLIFVGICATCGFICIDYFYGKIPEIVNIILPLFTVPCCMFAYDYVSPNLSSFKSLGNFDLLSKFNLFSSAGNDGGSNSSNFVNRINDIINPFNVNYSRDKWINLSNDVKNHADHILNLRALDDETSQAVFLGEVSPFLSREQRYMMRCYGVANSIPNWRSKVIHNKNGFNFDILEALRNSN